MLVGVYSFVFRVMFCVFVSVSMLFMLVLDRLM